MSAHLVGMILMIGTLAVLIWDAFLYFDKTDRNSITQVIIDNSKQYPFIPFLFGLLVGHLFG